ncbi:hypothetical protein [Paraburkholderia dilworthii]|uniref:hypothetical protein n=1 Tax=Paraburkholderia dilworthii TaxID=948106 RepID=UPI00041471BE|nr:hypothetical protein [Paraburkholderia dilworthii]
MKFAHYEAFEMAGKIVDKEIESFRRMMNVDQIPKTDWFPDSETPVHDGLYQTRVEGGITWSVWKDGSWHYATDNKDVAIKKAADGRVSFWQMREWRGLTKEAA